MLAQAIKRRLSKEENQKGFTLIELLAVIVILGIIAVIAIPMIRGVINNAGDNSDNATGRQIYEAARLYIMSEHNGDFSATHRAEITLDNLQNTHYLDDPLYMPSSKLEINTIFVNFNDTGVLTNVTGTGVAHSGFAVSLTDTAGKIVNLTAVQVLSGNN